MGQAAEVTTHDEVSPSVEVFAVKMAHAARVHDDAMDYGAQVIESKKAEFAEHKAAYDKLRQGFEPGSEKRGDSFAKRQHRHISAKGRYEKVLKREVDSAAKDITKYLRGRGITENLAEIEAALKAGLNSSQRKVDGRRLPKLLGGKSQEEVEAKVADNLDALLKTAFEGREEDLEHAKEMIAYNGRAIAASPKLVAAAKEYEASAESLNALSRPMLAERGKMQDIQSDINKVRAGLGDGEVNIVPRRDSLKVVELSALRSSFEVAAIEKRLAEKLGVVAGVAALKDKVEGYVAELNARVETEADVVADGADEPIILDDRSNKSISSEDFTAEPVNSGLVELNAEEKAFAQALAAEIREEGKGSRIDEMHDAMLGAIVAQESVKAAAKYREEMPEADAEEIQALVARDIKIGFGLISPEEPGLHVAARGEKAPHDLIDTPADENAPHNS